jgi:hypothetical protein
LKKRNVVNMITFNKFLEFKSLKWLDLTLNDNLSIETLKNILKNTPLLENINIDFELEMQIWENSIELDFF